MAPPENTVEERGDEAAESGDALRRGYARGRARDDEIRAGLEPIEPGTRPGAVVVAVSVAGLLGLTNVALYIAGVEIDGNAPQFPAVAAFAFVMFTLAIAMWRGSYWSVLAFQALLGGTVMIAALSLMVASDLEAVLLCVVISGLGGWLFWKLIRAMARMQMPPRELDR